MVQHVTDHDAAALANLLTQFQYSTNLKAFVSVLIAQVQDIEDALYQLLTETSLDVAIGAQLDVIGRLLRVDRAGRSDADYRLVLRTHVLVLKSSGSAPDIMSVLTTRYGVPATTWTLVDSGPACFVITLDSFSSPIVASVAETFALIKASKAAGIRFLYEYPPDVTPAEYFSFGPAADVDGTSFGFGSGAFSTVLEG